MLALLLIAAFVLSLRQTAAQSPYRGNRPAARHRHLLQLSGSLIPVTDEVQTARDSLEGQELYVQEGGRVEEGDALFALKRRHPRISAYSGTIENSMWRRTTLSSPAARLPASWTTTRWK